jgi:3-dehydroquinate synthase
MDAVAELIERNCRIKAAVVEADEREAGVRMVLNYGHTIGHAIEHLLGYELRHGECVALGMRVENEIAVRRGMMFPVDAERIAALLDAAGLPVELPERVEPEQIAERCRLDKKVRGGAVRVAVPARIGSWQMLENVTDEEIRAGLAIIQPPM